MSAPAVPQHSDAFRRRRFLNWFPLGLAYAFLYMGRYNLTVSKNALGAVMTKEDFGVIFGVGAIVYGVAFLLNGPLTDKIGGKRGMLIALAGSALMNLIMGLAVAKMVGGSGDASYLTLVFSVLYGANMYFQGFGALSIVKVNAHWFHVRERGGFSGIFGTMIASGIFLAFTVNTWILSLAAGGGAGTIEAARWVFFAPAALLAAMFVVELFLLKDRPGLAGHEDFDTADASSGEGDERPRLRVVIRRIATNPIILTIAVIEFCTGVIRNGVMHWFTIYTDEVLVLPRDHYLTGGSWAQWWLIVACFAASAAFFLLARRASKRRAVLIISGALAFLAPFLQGGWGGVLMVAGVVGGNVAGWVSDLFFQSRRAPAAGGLYGVLCLAAIAMLFVLPGTTTTVDWVAPSKTPGVALRPGDRIVSVAETPAHDWSDVQRAIACLPAACQGGAVFDARKCMCTNTPEEAWTGPPHQGPIPVRVVRDGVETELLLPDPGTSMRAGDVRKLKAGPVTTLSPYWLGLVVFIMSMGVIGTHGVLSGTATMDFGGRKGAATAVGLIDGCVYLGTAVQSFALGFLTTRSWTYWPLFLLPFCLFGFYLCTRIWQAAPRGIKGGGH